MGSRFVRPELTTIPISQGDTLTVRARLTAGERRAMYSRMYYPDTVKVDPMRVHLATLTAYLVDWSLVDDAGRRVPIEGLPVAELETILNALDPESFTEIAEAIDRHADAHIAPRDTEKNASSAAA